MLAGQRIELLCALRSGAVAQWRGGAVARWNKGDQSDPVDTVNLGERTRWRVRSGLGEAL